MPPASQHVARIAERNAVRIRRLDPLGKSFSQVDNIAVSPHADGAWAAASESTTEAPRTQKKLTVKRAVAIDTYSIVQDSIRKK
jgi:hypothetical protein